jgi:hypothetical protein
MLDATPEQLTFAQAEYGEAENASLHRFVETCSDE